MLISCAFRFDSNEILLEIQPRSYEDRIGDEINVSFVAHVHVGYKGNIDRQYDFAITIEFDSFLDVM
jgi:hypothetical protein